MQNRYKKQRQQRNLRIGSLVVLSIIFAWLIASIFSGKNPIQYANDLFTRDPNISQVEKMNKKELRKFIRQIELQYDSVSTELKECQKQIMNRKALIQVEHDFLNMRAAPSLDAEILVKIPNGKEVDVIQIDPKTYFLENRAGRWVQIKYKDQEGWVWGNYLKL